MEIYKHFLADRVLIAFFPPAGALTMFQSALCRAASQEIRARYCLALILIFVIR